MTSDHESFMRIALEEAHKGKAEGNLAVGSIIVRNGEVIATGHNLATTDNDPTAHAETVAIRNAASSTGKAEFPGCTLYTTFEPCPMCTGAIMTCNFDAVVMGGRPTPENTRWADYTIEKLVDLSGWKDRLEVITGVLVQECVDVRQKTKRELQEEGAGRLINEELDEEV